ncbi:hypothetical protein [Pseudoalteromonas tunicata]|jgi:hypothetical protein|uniref:Mannose-sensitive agglutinin (MSHA) biogenesis protein MshJ (Pilus type IV) n=1 Tax=Pseudoalteromonas tunicata D2 TaxID=87626 RepID=A4C8H6_9GAMM|nr:hypothetical protein [Pseudoalteromonas tunicata]ATC93395.1 hypothetical protein PTUN_a0628 [Pseudoalteromonas tunicata]AXT32439.1 hypothetical protein D1819_17470 [Pseudoalteromonas tunicata]EAR28891.1 hypothetical protein PTD2_07604 [Pseudoalteromonas tunicata D2]
MSELKKHAPLLAIALFLVILKFFFVPVFEWQERELSEQKLTLRKIEKSNSLLENKEQLIELKGKLQAELSEISTFFYPYMEESRFKLEQQKIIEAQLNQYQLTSKRLGWLVNYEETNPAIIKLDLEYSFEGEGSQVFSYLLQLSADPKVHVISKLNLGFRGQRPGNLGIVTVFMAKSYYMHNDKGQ